MADIESFIINAILIIFPMLIYEYFVVYRQNLKKKKTKILLSIALYLSFFMAVYYKKYTDLDYQFMSIIVPIVIAFLHNKTLDALIMSLFVLIYSIVILDYKLIIMLPFFIVFSLIYRRYSKTNKGKMYFAKWSILLVLLVTILNNVIKFDTRSFLVSMCSVFIYAVSIIIIVLGIDEAEKVVRLHTHLKEFEKEKDYRLTMFKITHEIKNPLAVVNGYIDMFDVNDKEKSKRYLGIMKNELNRSINLLNDFLEFNKIKVNIKETNFNLIIEEVKNVLIPLFNKKKVDYYFTSEEDLNIKIDGIRMKQVLINIIKNAIEACEVRKGIVKTEIYIDGKDLVITVKDNGEGMSKETLEKILTPFNTTKEYGTGLGVSLSNEIVKAHNGSITYTSELKKGTTCKIVIPIKD